MKVFSSIFEGVDALKNSKSNSLYLHFDHQLSPYELHILHKQGSAKLEGSPFMQSHSNNEKSFSYFYILE